MPDARPKPYFRHQEAGRAHPGGRAARRTHRREARHGHRPDAAAAAFDRGRPGPKIRQATSAGHLRPRPVPVVRTPPSREANARRRSPGGLDASTPPAEAGRAPSSTTDGAQGRVREHSDVITASEHVLPDPASGEASPDRTSAEQASCDASHGVRCLSAESAPGIVACRFTSPTPSALGVSHPLSGLILPSPRGFVSRHIHP